MISLTFLHLNSVMKFPYNLNNFPKTRYQGSKRKILPWMHSVFKKLEFDTVLDGFGGTGVVSFLLKKILNLNNPC